MDVNNYSIPGLQTRVSMFRTSTVSLRKIIIKIISFLMHLIFSRIFLRVSLVVSPCYDDVIPTEGRESRAAGNVVARIRQTERHSSTLTVFVPIFFAHVVSCVTTPASTSKRYTLSCLSALPATNTVPIRTRK